MTTSSTLFYRKRVFQTKCAWRWSSGALSIKPLEGSRFGFAADAVYGN